MKQVSEITDLSAKFRCLVLEDDVAFANMVCQVVLAEGGAPTHCGTLAEASAASARSDFELLLLDNHLPDGQAYDFFENFNRRHGDAPVIMITGMPDLTKAVSLTRNGLFDYLIKPVEIDALTACLRRARLRLQSQARAEMGVTVLGNSLVMRGVIEQLRQAARHPTATVLFTGESGTGKDLAAQTLHRLTFGERASQAPFVALNAAAVPAEMFEAELFGAERGAYTGADKRRPGLVSEAQRGTLFLDEIAEVPLALQAKLLRFLENREFRALGGGGAQAFTGRFVTATNKSVHDEVRAGRFREDLLYRIEVLIVALPPLRERREDIPGLAENLLAQIASRYERPVPLLRPEDLDALHRHSFPGNIRELRNILERSLLRTPDDTRWLALDLAWLHTAAANASARTVSNAAGPGANSATIRFAATADGTLPPERANLPPIEAQEYRLIRDALRQANGGIRRTAAAVGLSPQALLRRLEKWPELRATTSAH